MRVLFKVAPYAGIYAFGLALLLLTTLASEQLVGSDIHVEYYFAKLAAAGQWDPAFPHAVNTCLSIILLAPALSWLLHLDLMTVFKIIYPMLYALVPVFLVLIYKRFMPLSDAVLAAAFFISIPTFFLEMPQVARQEIGQLIIVALLLVLLSNIPFYLKAAIMAVGSLAVVLAHYSSTTIWLIFLFAAVLAYLLKKEYRHTLIMSGIAGIGIAGFVFWSNFGWQGVDVGNAVIGIGNNINNVAAGALPAGVTRLPVPIGPLGYMASVAFAADFFEVDNWSKAFRVIQLMTEVALIIGVFIMLRSKVVPLLYKIWILAIVGIMIVALLLPVLSSLLNPSRLYHLALIIVAPGLVLAFGEKWKRAFYLIFIYLIFTSGLVFHFAGYTDISKPTVPYSISLENERLDAGNYLTADDSAVAKWAFDNGIEVVYGDIGGTVILQEYYNVFRALPVDGKLPQGYLFLRTWNLKHNTFSLWAGPGLRRQVPIPDYSNRPVLFQQGQSVILGMPQ